MELRPYQMDAVDNLRKAIMTSQRVILQSATGSGKSIIFTDLAKKAVEKGKKVLILTHREEIFNTTCEHLRRSGIKIEPINPKNKTIDPFAQVYLAMVETFHRRNLLLPINFIIIDEAHFNNFSKVMDEYPNVKTVGVTATPIGKHIHKYYTDIVQTISIKDLIKQGYLMPCRAYQMQDDISDLKKSGNDYSDESLYAHYNKREKYFGVVQEYKKRAIGKPTLIFNVNIKHCEQMHQEFIDSGIKSAVVTSETDPDIRKQILQDFQNKKIDVINSVGILTTGVDMPCTEVVIVNRATTSLALWLQMQGRASRPYPGKKEFIVLDFGKNHDEHGLWVEDREWSIKPPKNKKQGIPAVKDCPSCMAMIPASARKCEFCEHEMEVKPVKWVKGKMVEIVPIIKKYSKSLAFTYDGRELYEAWQEKSISYKFAVRVAARTNQLHTFAAAGGYDNKWIYMQKNIYKQ